ncbi:uncharacterized protein LOC103710882 isoform X2 [Phoenix dactylifera]|uniref:Uncharacterized protein LOC103710882 isoform X2 n=1 Tax=Phoenix dactylifera TaxID=42345 RepID=A0A8B7CAB1_PHODC|nr:uncharacterized protein LOC103710882 isoform X2 [Phoenix dactylifera]
MMASAVPQPPAPPPPPSQRPAAAVPVASQMPVATAVEANAVRLEAVVKRLALYINGAIRVTPFELFRLYFALARGIDYALSSNDIPGIAHRLPPLIKQAYQRRNDSSLQSAITMLMISAKNACKKRWFQSSDSEELLSMANELCSSFCMPETATTDVINALDTISIVMSRYYPHLKFSRSVVSFEAKHGYHVLMADFQIGRNIPADEKIRLFVVRTDNLETSSCIINPPHVSFLVNGRGVDRRTNISMDTGPQFPTDITKMLKYGTNIIQAVGFFNGNYVIVIAFMSKIAYLDAPVLQDYVQPVAAELVSDSEIIEGPSRISLNCPISFKRIKTPVKGHLCKHHQCFDYDNFMEVNSRKPSWRCPCCNTPASYIDLRIDQNMVKILKEAGEGVSDVVIFADESWKAVVKHNGTTDELHDGRLEGQQDGSIESDINTVTVVDLTMEDDDQSEMSQNGTCEFEDRKPFEHIQGFSGSEFHSELPVASTSGTTQVAAHHVDGIWSRNLPLTTYSNVLLAPTNGSNAHASGTLESLVPDIILNPVITDAVSPALNRDATTNHELSQPTLSFHHATQLRQLMQLQQSHFGGSIINNEIARPSLPRHISRNPIAVQALPVQTQTPNASRRMWTNILSSTSVIPNSPASATYQTNPPLTSASDGFGAVSGDMEIEQLSSTSDAVSSSLHLHTAAQNRDRQDHQYTLNPAMHQVVGLRAPYVISTRAPGDQQRGAGAYRATLHPVSELQNPHQILNQRTHQITCQSGNIPQFSLIPPMQVQQASQNAVGQAAGSSGSIRNILAAQHAAQAVRLQAGTAAVHPQIPRTAPSTPATADRGPALSLSRSDGLPELPFEQNWRPTGRMRGSLTGSAYSAALSQYLVPPPQSLQVRPPVTTVPISISDHLSVFLANSINARGPLTQQANLRQGEGNQPGGSST